MHRSLALILLLAGTLLLSACASRSPRPIYTNPDLPQRWEAEGKAAVRTPERGANIYFTWTQDGDDYRIIVRGPLGLGRAELTGSPQQVTLRADNIQEMSAGSLEDLLEAATRRRAPVSRILHWLKAEAATPAARTSRDADGKPSKIREDGWTITYLEWSKEAPNLPRRLTIEGPEGKATVVIGLWRLDLPDSP